MESEQEDVKVAPPQECGHAESLLTFSSKTHDEKRSNSCGPSRVAMDTFRNSSAELQSRTERPEELVTGKEISSQDSSSSQQDFQSDSAASDFAESDWSDLCHLDRLPSEILLHITSFLDAEFIIQTLGRVSCAFHSLIIGSSFWKLRMRKRWPKNYPPIPVAENEFDWSRACVDREVQYRRWTNVATEMDYFKFKEGLYGAVDSVHLMERGGLLAIGSRDRYLNLLDLSKLDQNEPESAASGRIFCKENAHTGWIWSIASYDRTLATGSWDTRIKFWDLSTMEQICEAKANSAILCMKFESDVCIAGSYDKKVYHFDPRSAGVVCTSRYHTKPVLCLAANDRYILTGSEDSTIVVYDRRASQVLKKLKLDQYPMSMSYDGGQLWIGDKSGCIHLADASDGDLKLIETYNVGHKGKVTGIIHTPGALFTCSTDSTIKVHEPNLDPGLIVNLTDNAAELAEISYQDGVLACASSGIFVGIYKPKTGEA